MSLPWFPFNIKDFIANTRRLNTEAKGAYLCLMLDYYQQGKPPPDDDQVLATIAELPIESWIRHRKVIEPLFEPRDGLWHHPRIEQEMLEACSKQAVRSARAQHAALAKAAKQAPSKPQAPGGHTPSKKPSPGTAPSKPRASPESTHLTLNTTTLTSSSSAQASENDDSTKVIEEPGKVEDVNPLGTVLPETWVPGELEIVVARDYGMTDVDLEQEVLMFHALNAQNGTFSHNWSGTWRIFCARWRDRRSKDAASRAPPRIDVSTSPAQPTTKDWEYGAAAWARSQSLWPRSLGADPLSGRCKCPADILRKHGIDPATGGALKPEEAT